MVASLPGPVYLIGAGPGAVQYLTLQAQQILAQAEVLLYDALVDETLLDLVPADCELQYVGKRGGEPSPPQAEIDRMLIEQARRGKRVIRLKGGDPFIFGRSQSEIASLRAAGCPYQVVPGLSAALFAPLVASIPLTDPVLSRSFTVLTAHDLEALNWKLLGQTDTLVILMGGGKLSEIILRLREQGRSPETPIAVIRWAGQPQQQIWSATLGSIERQIAGQRLSPCVIVIGEVVRLREMLKPLLEVPELDSPLIHPSQNLGISPTQPKSQEPKEQEPKYQEPKQQGRSLHNRTILVTRAATQAGQFTQTLTEQGATVIELPALEIVPPTDWGALDGAIAEIESFQWLILTSANAVDFFFDRLKFLQRDIRVLANTKLAVVGEKTSQSLQQRGLRADFIPPDYVADAMAAHWPAPLAGQRLLFPRVESGGREVLVQQLSEQGARVLEVAAYQSRCPDQVNPQALAALQTQQLDAITFASSKTVQHFCQMLERSQTDNRWHPWLQGVAIASIGPQTSKACQSLLGRVDIEAEQYTLQGLAQALVAWFDQRPEGW